jgi:hypothetical protein
LCVSGDSVEQLEAGVADVVAHEAHLVPVLLVVVAHPLDQVQVLGGVPQITALELLAHDLSRVAGSV